MGKPNGLPFTRNITAIPLVTSVRSKDVNDMQDCIVSFGGAGYGMLGDGSDGSFTFDGVAVPAFATLAAGVYTLTRGTALVDATFVTGVRLNTSGEPFIGTGVLTTTDVAQIFSTGSNGGNGTNGTVGAGGVAGLGASSGSLHAACNGGTGGIAGTGGTGVAIAGFGGAGGNGGNAGVGTNFGPGGVLSTPSVTLGRPTVLTVGGGYMIGQSAGTPTLTMKGCGSGGGGGGGSSTVHGGGGGASGGPMVIAFGYLNLAHATDIMCNGGNGGNGGSGPSDNGSGGGGGGGGGVLDIIYLAKKAGLVFSAAVNCPGGIAGTGGAGDVGFNAGHDGVAGGVGAVYEFALQPPIMPSVPANTPSALPYVYGALPDPSTFPANSLIVRIGPPSQLFITFDNINWTALT